MFPEPTDDLATQREARETAKRLGTRNATQAPIDRDKQKALLLAGWTRKMCDGVPIYCADRDDPESFWYSEDSAYTLLWLRTPPRKEE